jgi:predicted  nucleic acid-binding Zn-ribbon protein
MKQTLERISALQDLNRQIEQLQREAEMLSIDVRNLERQLEERKRRAAQAHQQRRDALRQADAVQMKISEAEADIARLKGQLNVTRNQKEYDIIRHAILSRQADVQKWEDDGLAALQTVDELAKEEARLAEEVRRAEGELTATKGQVAEQQAELDRRMADLREERDGVRRDINPNVLSAYERLTSHHRSRALAEVRNRICQGCYTRITKQTENLLMRGDEIVYCHSCGRMLMLVD